MNIGLVIYGTLDTVSGGYLYDRMLAEYLRNCGDRVVVFSQPSGGCIRNLADNFSSALMSSLSGSSLDILIEDELNHPSLFLLNRRLQRRASYPILSLVHHLRSSEPGHRLTRNLHRRMELSYLRTVDGFIFNSTATLKSVEALLATERPAVIAYPGCDHLIGGLDRDAVAARCRQQGPLDILFIGNVIPRKGLHTLISALAGLPGELWTLTVVGSLDCDPAYSRRMRRQAERLGPGRVKMLGTVSNSALAPLLVKSHCLAVPSFYEGYGIVFAEAMAFGMPVIAGRVGAVPEVVTDGREGFLVPPGDVAALSRVIGRLIGDRRLLESMSMNALARRGQFPTWSQSGSKIRGFLKDFLSPDGRKP
jgi:glycosyltransferase involved in cell wall biosynthesis